MENGKIGAVEKRAVVALIDKEYDEIIGQLEQQERLTITEATLRIVRKFNVKKILNEIGACEKQIANLKNALEKLGFNASGSELQTESGWEDGVYHTYIQPNTPAGRMFYQLVARQPIVLRLKKDRQDRIKGIWLEDDRSTVRKIANQALPKIEITDQAKLKLISKQ